MQCRGAAAAILLCACDFFRPLRSRPSAGQGFIRSDFCSLSERQRLACAAMPLSPARQGVIRIVGTFAALAPWPAQ